MDFIELIEYHQCLLLSLNRQSAHQPTTKSITRLNFL